MNESGAFEARSATAAPRGKWVRLAVILLFSIVLTTGLSGCLLNRLFEVREQFCEFEDNFVMGFDGRPSVQLRQPVLLDSDITWLAGTAPTRTVTNGDERIMTYVIEEAVPEPDPAKDLTIEFSFDLLDEEFKLSQIRFDSKFDTVMNREYLDEATLLESATNICQTGWRFGSTRVEMDITDRDLEMLPNRQEVLDLMGPPHTLSEEDSGWIYMYRLKGNTDSSKVARFTVWFDETTGNPVRMESHYSRYRTRADFLSRKMSMNVEI